MNDDGQPFPDSNSDEKWVPVQIPSILHGALVGACAF
jgi:hypothetical protein